MTLKPTDIQDVQRSTPATLKPPNRSMPLGPPRRTAERRRVSRTEGASDGGQGSVRAGRRPTDASRVRRSLITAVSLALPLLAALFLLSVIVGDDVHIFRPTWILHPDETGMLFIGKHVAETGSFLVRDDWYLQSPAHVPEGVTEAGGRLVPQKALLGYLAYAGAFLISEDGWRYVTPFFGLLAAAAAGWLVLQKTGSRWAALAAAAALATSSPMIIYASGLAFVDVIALALYLMGAIALQRSLRRDSPVTLAVAGLAFGAAMITRYDFFVAGVLVLAVVLWHRRREVSLLTNLQRALPGIAPFAALVGLTTLANWWLYGSPIASGYQDGSWQSSAGGVSSSLYDFSAPEFASLGWSYLFQIGLSCTLLLAVGLAVKTRLRRWDETDALLLSFAAFGAFYFLGKEGAYGSDEAWLVGSYPRYLLPVYAAGVIVGVEGILLALVRLGWNLRQASLVLLAVALTAAGIGMHEAFSNERGVGYVERLTLVHDGIRQVTEHTPYPVVISDLSSKAVVDDYTITPRLLDDPDEVVRYVRRELQSRRHVLLVPNRDHPLYTGYVRTIEAAGYQLILRRQNPLVYEMYNPWLYQPNDAEGSTDDSAAAAGP